MAHTYEELKKKTVADLRKIASEIEHEAVKGYSQLNKEHLLVAICKALSIDTHAHHEVHGVNKTAIKVQIQELKKLRGAALEAHEHVQLKRLRRKIHALKRKMRNAMS
jgi:DNA-binding IclR family transcriptional regulator